MRGKHVICVSGWAHDDRPLRPLLHSLGSKMSVTVFAPHQLVYSPGLDVKARAGDTSPYAKQLQDELARIDRPFVLVGWSMGGMIALETVLQGRVSPTKLVLLSTTPRFVADRDFPVGSEERELRAMIYEFRKDPETTLRKFMQRVGVSAQEQDTRIAKISNTSNAALLEGLQYLLEIDLRGKLSELKVETLIAHGGEDAVIPCQAGRFLHHQLLGSELHVAPTLGHDILDHENSEIVGKVRDFIAR